MDQEIWISQAARLLPLYDRHLSVFENTIANISYVTVVLAFSIFGAVWISANFERKFQKANGRLSKLYRKNKKIMFVTASAILASYIAYQSFKNGNEPLSSDTIIYLASSKWYVAFICLVFGLLVYTARCRFRKCYAIVEISVGLLSAQQSSSFNEPYGLLPFFAGLYVIVRGIDNFEKGLAKQSSLRSGWEAVFGKPYDRP